jgi:hypothetical protein
MMKKIYLLLLISLTLVACNTKEDPTPQPLSIECQWVVDNKENYQQAVDSLDYYHSNCYLFSDVNNREYYCNQFDTKSWFILNYSLQLNKCQNKPN